MGKKKLFFQAPELGPEPNTFIGGYGVVATTPALLASVLAGVSESDIENFKIDINGNISCFINVSHTISYQFVGQSSLTYYVDAGSKMWGFAGNSFYSNNNCKHVWFPNVKEIGAGGGFRSFGSMPVQDYCFLPKTDKTYHTAFDSFTKVKTLHLPVLTTIVLATSGSRRTSFQSLASLKRMVMPATTSMSWNYINTSVFAGVGTGCVFYCNPAVTQRNNQAYLMLRVFGRLSIDDEIWFNGLRYRFHTPYEEAGDFYITGNITQQLQQLVARINGDTRIGLVDDIVSISTSVYLGVSSRVAGAQGNTIPYDITNAPTVSVNFGTQIGQPTGFFEYGGTNLHPYLQKAQDDRGCEIRTVTDFTLPNPPTNVKAVNQTETSIDLTFTPPTPNVNGNDGYEVWIDDGVTPYLPFTAHKEILHSGDTVDLTGYNQVGLKIKVRTFDGLYNLSEFSETIIL